MKIIKFLATLILSTLLLVGAFGFLQSFGYTPRAAIIAGVQYAYRAGRWAGKEVQDAQAQSRNQTQ